MQFSGKTPFQEINSESIKQTMKKVKLCIYVVFIWFSCGPSAIIHCQGGKKDTYKKTNHHHHQQHHHHHQEEEQQQQGRDVMRVILVIIKRKKQQPVKQTKNNNNSSSSSNNNNNKNNNNNNTGRTSCEYCWRNMTVLKSGKVILSALLATKPLWLLHLP